MNERKYLCMILDICHGKLWHIHSYECYMMTVCNLELVQNYNTAMYIGPKFGTMYAVENHLQEKSSFIS